MSAAESHQVDVAIEVNDEWIEAELLVTQHASKRGSDIILNSSDPP
jgi:hypothetical protein